FQAEDGIRDRNVTGVQTCALPISAFSSFSKSVMFQSGANSFKSDPNVALMMPAPIRITSDVVCLLLMSFIPILYDLQKRCQHSCSISQQAGKHKGRTSFLNPL